MTSLAHQLPPKPIYTCSACGLGVIVLPPAPPIRACRCAAVIIAHASSALVGAGGVKA